MIGDGSILVLYAAAVIAVVIIVRDDGKRILPVILSIPALIAASAALVIKKVTGLPFKSRFVKIIATAFAACICILAIASSGRSVFSRELCEKAENEMHLPGGVMQAMMAMQQVARKIEAIRTSSSEKPARAPNGRTNLICHHPPRQDS